MGLFRRKKQERDGVGVGQGDVIGEVTVALCEGSVSLEVVGESYHQDNLWSLVGGFTTEHVRQRCIAMLLPEDNPHDPNAIAVHVSGLLVGYLPRATAAAYRPGLEALMRRHRHVIALNGEIVGGGPREDGIGRLGIWLEHDPADFVIGERPLGVKTSHVRTGANVEGGTGALKWLHSLATDDAHAIPQLRKLLASETSPRERHYMYAQLEHHLYHSRDAFSSALDEYDAVCRDHDSEMDRIRPALVADFSGVPFLELYKQASIRHQHVHDYQTALWWAERGLVVYGDMSLDAEWIDDLTSRAERFRRTLNPEPRPARTPMARPPLRTEGSEVETLTCATCGANFERFRTRGRKPTACPACHGKDAALGVAVRLDTSEDTGDPPLPSHPLN